MRGSFTQPAGRNRRAFSLMELMVVVVTAAVFTLIAVPMWMSRQKRDLAVEARALLDAVYAAERVWYAENDAYLEIASGDVGNGLDDTPPGLGLACQGNTYFSAECFSVTEDETYGFVAACNGGVAGNDAPKASRVSDLRCEMRGTNEFRLSTNSGATWSSWE